jgi:Dimerisation domain
VSPAPEPDPFEDTFIAMAGARAVITATRLGVFDALADEAAAAPAVADRLGLERTGVEALLTALAAEGYLEGGYRRAPSPERECPSPSRQLLTGVDRELHRGLQRRRLGHARGAGRPVGGPCRAVAARSPRRRSSLGDVHPRTVRALPRRARGKRRGRAGRGPAAPPRPRRWARGLRDRDVPASPAPAGHGARPAGERPGRPAHSRRRGPGRPCRLPRGRRAGGGSGRRTRRVLGVQPAPSPARPRGPDPAAARAGVACGRRVAGDRRHRAHRAGRAPEPQRRPERARLLRVEWYPQLHAARGSPAGSRTRASRSCEWCATSGRRGGCCTWPEPRLRQR